MSKKKISLEESNKAHTSARFIDPPLFWHCGYLSEPTPSLVSCCCRGLSFVLGSTWSSEQGNALAAARLNGPSPALHLPPPLVTCRRHPQAPLTAPSLAQSAAALCRPDDYLGFVLVVLFLPMLLIANASRSSIWTPSPQGTTAGVARRPAGHSRPFAVSPPRQVARFGRNLGPLCGR